MSLRALTWAKQQRVGDPIAKLVLLCLADAMNAHHEYAFPSQARLADECECSRQTVNKKLAWLEEKGFVCRERTKDTTGRDTGCRYHLLGVNDGDTGVNERDTGVNEGDRGVSTTFTPGVNDGDTSKGNLNINPKREPSQRGARLTLSEPPADWIAWAEGEGHHDPPDEWLRFRDCAAWTEGGQDRLARNVAQLDSEIAGWQTNSQTERTPCRLRSRPPRVGCWRTMRDGTMACRPGGNRRAIFRPPNGPKPTTP